MGFPIIIGTAGLALPTNEKPLFGHVTTSQPIRAHLPKNYKSQNYKFYLLTNVLKSIELKKYTFVQGHSNPILSV